MNNKWPLGGHVFLTDLNHFLPLPRYGENVSSRLFICCHYIHMKKTAPLPGGHVFSLIMTIFKLVRDIHITNAKHVTSRVKKTPPPPGGYVFCTDPNHYRTQLAVSFAYENEPVTGRKNAPPLGSHVFQAKFHEDWKINVASRVLTRKNAPPPDGHVFQPTIIIFELVRDIIGMNLLPKFHEDRTINMASRVKNAPPLVSHVFQANITIFEFIQDINETNLLTKVNEDWTINVASRELTSQMLTPHNARRTKGDKKNLTMSTLCSGELQTGTNTLV
ncbi:hypothetical protein DPMN_063376 [Dreissena polymorpha]|uniref:Uncharacterized protein n=1 Tax=Dreissena polymorpha TaxID=45954 RepID=A0A9D4CAE4_DREPO|nr:hypothetical protein DPMN_063376 [Dreissena polymorpha]